MARSVQFVTDPSGLHWLMPSRNWLKGWIEQRWFERQMGIAKRTDLASFSRLSDKFGPRVIEQDDRGEITFTPIPLRSKS